MAKEFNEIMQDMQAWQKENEDRAVICFAVGKQDCLSCIVAGRGTEVITAMAGNAIKDEAVRELIEAALEVAKMAKAIEDVVVDDVDDVDKE